VPVGAKPIASTTPLFERWRMSSASSCPSPLWVHQRRQRRPRRGRRTHWSSRHRTSVRRRRSRPPFDGAPLTLTSADAARAGKLLNARWIVPLQIRGWAHFSEGPASIDTAFRRRHERPVATPHPGPDHHPYLARVTATCQRQPRGVRVAADFRWRKCGNADCGKRAIVAARDRHDSGIGSPRAHRAPVQ
jgi:hypothetical protein